MEKKNLSEDQKHRIALAGAVTSTMVTLQALVRHQMNVVAVFGYEIDDPSLVSGYVSMMSYCKGNDIPYYPFEKINDPRNIEILKSLHPDIFFVVGLSQLISSEMLSIARLGNIGFHPTVLPKGRGRAPIAWLILEEGKGAANFFLMDKGVDSGPIFIQEPFEVSENDNAQKVENKIVGAMKVALDKWLPQLKKGVWKPVPQDESAATYYGKRSPLDGWINWVRSAVEIDKLIRASSYPHPGAYTFSGKEKITILSTRVDREEKIKGIAGCVLLRRDAEGEYLVQTGEGLLWISDIRDESGRKKELKVGQHLGYYSEYEIYKLKKEIDTIKKKLGI